MTSLRSVLVLLSGLLFSADGIAQELETVQKGKGLFDKYCAGCHGTAAVGQSTDDPAGGWDKDKHRLAPALNGSGHAWHHSPSVLFKYIQMGSIDKSSPMPSFRDRLSDSDIRSIIAYIQSLWPEALLKEYKKRFGYEVR